MKMFQKKLRLRVYEIYLGDYPSDPSPKRVKVIKQEKIEVTAPPAPISIFFFATF